MLHLFSGDDRDAIAKAFGRFTDPAKEDGTYRRHTADVSVPMLDPYFSESLFGGTSTVLLDGVSLFPEDTRAFLLGQFSVMQESANTFILVDGAFSKEFRDAAKDAGVRIIEYSKGETEDRSAVFQFTDAYLSRDKKRSWLLLTGLLRGGAAPEEIHGALFWAVKSLWLTASGLGGSPEELGMKPFVYQKTKRFLGGWEEGSAREAFRALGDLLEDTRRSGGDLAFALERFVLL